MTANSMQSTDLVFTAPREKPWRRVDDYTTIEVDGKSHFEGNAGPGEFFVFQIVVVPGSETGPLAVEFSDLSGTGTLIPAGNLRCISLGGIGSDGKPFDKKLCVPAETAQVLWCGIDVPEEARGGYTGSASIFGGDRRIASVELAIEVTGTVLSDHGESRDASLSRLRWLDSTIGSEPTVTAPYDPVRTMGRTVAVLGRELILGENGLPDQIRSFFHPTNTRLVETPRSVLASPFSFCVETSKGTEDLGGVFGTLESTPVEARWSASLTGSGLSGSVSGVLDYTGSGSLEIKLRAEREIEIEDLRMEVPWNEDAAGYFMGLNRQGGRRVDEPLDWSWDPGMRQDCLWMGDVNAGLMLRFKGANYRRPAVNIYYSYRSLFMPESWGNDGKGGIRVDAASDGRVNVKAYTGARLLRNGEELTFTVELYVTPFRVLDTENQWKVRFDHPRPVRNYEFLRNKVEESRPEYGANVLNIHQAHAAAPYINYPYADDNFPELKALVKKGHEHDLKVRIYYTTREVTQNMPELHALHSMNGEVILPGPGAAVRTIIHKDGPHPWLIENLGEAFVPAWVDHLGLPNAEWDLSVLTTPDSRWNNFYLEGLRLLVDQADIDGIYIDDTALDARSLRRARRILDRRPGRLIDFHTWNHFNSYAGFASNLLMYMELLPYFDRIWIGEGFHCNRANLDFWLVEMSGLPFGVMSEMLQDVNPWRGLVFGEVARLNWSGDPGEIWRAWDQYGIHGTEFIPYYASENPVGTGRTDIVATTFKGDGYALVAIGSWAQERCDINLEVDWDALGLDPLEAKLYAPRIPGFQSEAVVAPGESLTILPGRGYFLVLDETSRDVRVPAYGESLVETFRDPFGAPVLEAGWEVRRSDNGDARAFGGALEVKAPANTYAGIERALPPETVAAEVEIRPGDDASRNHSPGVALVWNDGGAVKLGVAPADNLFHVYAGGTSCAVPGKIGSSVLIRIIVAEEAVLFQSRKDPEDDWDTIVEMARGGLSGYPNLLRIGKMSAKAEWIDSPREPGEVSVSTYYCPQTYANLLT